MISAAHLALICLALLGSAGWLWPAARASLPPVRCANEAEGTDCTVVNAWRVWRDYRDCKFARVFYPTSEEELVATVALAVRTGTKLRLVSKWAHAEPKLVCPAGDRGFLISTRDYNKIVSIDLETLTVTVEAGVMLQDLVDRLAEQGLAIAHSPYWSGLSIAGLLATGAHGSGLWGKGSAVHEYVTQVRVVVPAPAAQGYATVRTFSSGNPKELAALKVSLGVLGAVSQVTLQVEPLFKRSVTYDLTDDEDLESLVQDIAREQEFGDIAWFPAHHRALYRLDNRVPLGTPGDGFVKVYSPVREPNLEASRARALLREASRNAPGKCADSLAATQGSADYGFGFYNLQSDNRSVNNGYVFQGYPVVGFQHRLQTSGDCGTLPEDVANPTNPVNQLCVSDLGPKGPFFVSGSLSVELSRAADFFRDVRALVARRPLGLCDIFNGDGRFHMRFVRGNSSALLGKPADAIEVDVIQFRANDGRTPRLNQGTVEEVEQMLAFKYAGLPHWGKNRHVAFVGAAAKVPPARLGQFLEVKEALDPDGLFSNEWTDAVLGLAGSVEEVRPFCALEGLCRCSEDVHCAPEAGYFCRPGLVYKAARVCRFEGRKVFTSSS